MAIKYEFHGTQLTSTSETTLLTAPTNQQIIIKSIRVSTVGAFTPSVSFQVEDSSTSTKYYVQYLKLLVANTSVEVLDNPLVLESADKLLVTSTTTDRLDITISYMGVATNE